MSDKRKTLFFEYTSYYGGEEYRYLRGWASIAGWILGIITAASLLIGSLILLAIKLDKYDCNRFESNTGIETKYKNYACYANYKGDWVEKQNIILTIEGKK